MESGMSLIAHEMEAYQVQHLPIVKAYADKIGLVETVNIGSFCDGCVL
jgi:hypothetical protein